TGLVAIDIGKSFHAVLVEGADGRRQQFRMANSVDDYDRLVAFLRALLGTVRIALEPTGDFHRTLAHRLLREGFPVVSVSSVAGARYREAMFNSWDKNDPKDATVILHLLKQGIVQHYHDRSSPATTTSRNSPRPTTKSASLANGSRTACS